MNSKIFFLAGVLAIGPAPMSGWKVEPGGSKIQFQVSGPFGTVHGNFAGLKASIQFDEKSLKSSSITASIDAKTVSTGIGLRNRDLNKKTEWLNTDKFPLIRFRSQKIIKSGPAGYLAYGQLTIKGITKPVKIPFSFSQGKTSGHFTGGFTIKREDFGVGKPGGMVGSQIKINLDVRVRK